MVGQDAVYFFGHGAVEAAQPGLDVRHGDLEFGGRERAGERRVRVPVDEHDVRPFAPHHRLEPREHRPGLRAVQSAPHAQVVIRLGEAELLEEHGGHPVIVMLPRVHEYLVEAVAQRLTQRCGLDELRTGSDDGQEAHAGAACVKCLRSITVRSTRGASPPRTPN